MRNSSLPGACLFLLCLLAAACTMQNPSAEVSRPVALAAPAAPAPAATNADAARERLRRLQSLAASLAPPAPAVEQVYASTDTGAAIPVVRVVFPDRVLFNFDSDMPRPEAIPILDRLAAVLQRDDPGSALTIIGHTDAIGTDAYNIGLSRRRAESVMAALIAGGISPGRLSTVALGKLQPVAPNDTAAGRALNRRVEFLLSDSEGANLSVVQNQRVDAAWLSRNPGQAVREPATVEVLMPDRPDQQQPFHLVPTGRLVLRAPVVITAQPLPAAAAAASAPVQPATPVAVTPAPAPPVPAPEVPAQPTPAELAPAPLVIPATPAPVLPAPLHAAPGQPL